MLVLLERVYTANIYVAAKVNWWLKYTLSTDSLVRVYFDQCLWLKYKPKSPWIEYTYFKHQFTLAATYACMYESTYHLARSDWM